MILKIVGQVAVTLLLLALLLFTGFILLFIISFSMDTQRFYIPMLLIVIGILALYIILFNFRAFRTRRLFHKLSAVMLGICLLTAGGYEINHMYHKSLEINSVQDVDIEQYQPFQNKGTVAALGHKASFTLSATDDLPRLDGATALYPLYSAFVQAVYPEKEYTLYNSEVMGSGTGRAYEQLIMGESDIIFAMSPGEVHQKMAAESGLDLKLTPVGREAFVFFVHKDNPVTALTSEQIKDIYTGRITNWNQVGGNNEPIKAFQRPENSGSQAMLQKFLGDEEPMPAITEDVIAGMGGIIQQAAGYHNYKNAIGYSFHHFTTSMNKNDGIKLLAVDGALPDTAAIQSGAYPIISEFYAVTAERQGKLRQPPKPSVTKLLQWIVSEEGQSLVEATGYFPLK